MARRDAQRERSDEPLSDLCGRQAGRFPAWWAELSQREQELLRHRHEQAAALRARGHAAIRWERTSGEG
jgi:hypothetical protein